MQRDIGQLVDAVVEGRLSRRQLIARASALGLSASAMGSLLAACGGDDEASSTAGSPASKGELSGDLTLYKGPFSPDETRQVKQLLAPFRDEFPAVGVEVEQFQFEAMATEFPARFLSGSPPDVDTIPQEQLIQWIPRGVFADLTEYVEDPSWKSEFEAIPAAAWDLGRGPDGKIYGVPWWGSILSMLYVNLDLLEQAGVSDVNSSFDAFHAGARAVGDLGGDRFGFTIRANQYNPAAFDWGAWLHAAGAHLLNEDRTACQADTPEARAAFQMLADMQSKEKLSPAPGAYDQEGLRSLFQAGRVGIHHDTNDYLHVLTGSKPDFEYDVAAIPKGPAGDDSPTAMFGIGLLTMSSKSESPDAAWELVKYLSSAEVVTDYFQKVTLLPTRTDVTDRMYEDDPLSQKILEEISPGVEGWRLVPGIDEILQRSQPSFDALYIGDKTAEQALGEVCSVVESVI